MQTKIISDTLAKLKAKVIDYSDVEPALWANKKFVLAAVKQDLHAFAHTDISLIKDREIILAVVGQDEE